MLSKDSKQSAVPADVSECVESFGRVLARTRRVEAVLAGLPEQRACLVHVKFLVKVADSLGRRHRRPLHSAVSRRQVEDVELQNGVRQFTVVDITELNILPRVNTSN